MEALTQKRQTAYHVSIAQIRDADYIKSSGEWDPNFLSIGDEKVARVNVIGVVITVQEDDSGFRGFSFDDGTGNIPVRVFDSTSRFPKIQVGDIVLVIGRPREYNDERYIVPEIIRITDEAWLEARRKNSKLNIRKEEPKIEKAKVEEAAQDASISDEEPLSDGDKVFNAIREFDKGNGADIEDVLSRCGEDAEIIIRSLLSEGEIFEIRPGKVKILE